MPIRWTFAGGATGFSRLPSTNVLSLVMYCGRPLGPRRKRPYWSVASIGMFTTSVSDSSRPSMDAAWALMSAQVAMPPGAAFEQFAGGDRVAAFVELVVPEEDVMGRVRGVGLALVNPRGVRVRTVLDVVVRAEIPSISRAGSPPG